MIADKTLNVLHFEDEKTNQMIVRHKLKNKFGATTQTESTLQNLDIYFKTHYIDQFDLVICDWNFPIFNIELKLPTLAKSGKPILFYSCIDECEWLERVKKVLGKIPDNFTFNRKACDDIISTIRNIL